MHAEANAIIAASREEMLDASLYLVGRDMRTGEIMADATPCTMCRRLIINAGISRVVVRADAQRYIITNVRDWIYRDEITLPKDMY